LESGSNCIEYLVEFKSCQARDPIQKKCYIRHSAHEAYETLILFIIMAEA